MTRPVIGHKNSFMIVAEGAAIFNRCRQKRKARFPFERGSGLGIVFFQFWAAWMISAAIPARASRELPLASMSISV